MDKMYPVGMKYFSLRMHLCFLVMLVLLSGCSSGAVETVESKQSAQTDMPTEKPTMKPQTESGSESAIEAASGPASESSEDASAASDYMAENKYLLQYMAKASHFSAELGLSFDMDTFTFTDRNITQTEVGRICNVGDYYEDDQVMVGMGYNMDQEEMWYVSIEAPSPPLSELFAKYCYLDFVALANNPIPMGETFEEVTEFSQTIYDALVSDGEDKAIGCGDYVYVFKNTSKDRVVFAVDTLSYFNAFYKGTIKFIDLNS